MTLRTRTRRLSLAVVLAAATSLLIAACSSGSPGDSSTTGVTSTAGGSASAAGSRSAFCNTARRYWSERLVIARGEAKDMPGDTTQAGATPSRQVQVQAARADQAALPQLEASAPADLRTAVRTFVAGEKPYFDALVKAIGDESKIPPTYMAKSMSALNGPAGKAVTGYWSQTCGIQLGRAANHQ